MVSISGQLNKMTVSLAEGCAQYHLEMADQQLDMNVLVGAHIKLEYSGKIQCQNCQRVTKKSFSGGFCYPCSQKLAQCDLCFMKPETCHYAAGTCREPQWGEAVCMQDHIVYLANSSGLKVGITRINQVPIRWIDQGATQAIPIFRVKTRYQSGLVEVMFKNHVSDRTDWRKMLKGAAEPLNLEVERDKLFELCQADIHVLQQQFGEEDISLLPSEKVLEIDYPVNQYPSKVSSFNFDKTAVVEGKLEGIKGQYLILDKGVLNIRKFTGYHVSVEG